MQMITENKKSIYFDIENGYIEMLIINDKFINIKHIFNTNPDSQNSFIYKTKTIKFEIEDKNHIEKIYNILKEVLNYLEENKIN